MEYLEAFMLVDFTLLAKVFLLSAGCLLGGLVLWLLALQAYEMWEDDKVFFVLSLVITLGWVFILLLGAQTGVKFMLGFI